MEDTLKLHQELLYPSVRVLGKASGGSGTIIDSSKDKNGNYQTMILTNEHVIDDLISVEYDFDPRVGKDKLREKRSLATVQLFQYDLMSRVIGNLNMKATLEAYDADKDLALLKLKKRGKAEHVAQILPLDSDSDLHIFDDIYTVGCSFLHDPIAHPGIITGLSDQMDDQPFYLLNSSIIFGNSGGGAYIEHDGDWNLFGVPSRVAVYGWGVAHSSMGYVIPPSTLYSFLEDQNFQYIVDDNYTVEKCADLRKATLEKEQKGLESILDKLGD